MSRYRIQFIVALVCMLGSCSVWSKTVCCNMIGCFSNDPPFHNLPLPKCLEQMKIPPIYKLYVDAAPNVWYPLTHDSIPSVFKPGSRTVFVAHGWNSNGDSKWILDLKTSLINRENANVVSIDWKGAANNIVYPLAATNTRSIGAYTAMVIDNLVNKTTSDHSQMWCIGYSLGAQVCGHTGLKSKIGRVTGLDPAGPFFKGNPDLNIGINPSCGNFVDVIHTDNVLGTRRRLGHVDFYPNGERRQMPGCLFNGCSHGRSVHYFLESVRSDCFNSTMKCTSLEKNQVVCTGCKNSECPLMGYSATPPSSQEYVFYLETNKKSPYCKI